MTLWDDRILEYIRAEGGASVGKLGEQDFIKISNPHVSRRCKKLADHGLLRPLGNGVYVITERGERYLDGEISTYEDEPDEIPDQDDSEDESGVASPSGPG